MKKLIIYLFLLCFFASCEEVIEKRELDAVDNEDVWQNSDLARLYLNNLYSRTLPGFQGNANSGLSDESTGSGVDNMMYGMLTASSAYGTWGVDVYSHIRRINILLAEIDKGSIPEDQKNVIKGQALMMRAWIYWELVKLYGGVPMVMDVQDPNMGEGLFMERSNAATSIGLIVRDLDEAIEKLPPTWPATDFGRFTKAAAAGLKGRILLYYASPQFNPNNLAERWTVAYEANKQAKELALAAGHGLHTNFDRIFIDEANKEAIIVTVFDNTRISHGYERSVRPASVKSPRTTSSGNPTWEFVQAFPMKDGKPIQGHPDYNERLYWKNRDPRLNATVAYNSMMYPLPGGTIYTNPAQRRQWTYIASNGQPNNQELTQNTTTGFFLKKMINPAVPPTELNRTWTDWIELRYAEVLLNLAEAANEVGATDEAYTELKAIRKRAGITEGDGNFGLEPSMSKEAMRDVIMRERQVELAFENKRHWDLRRRNLFAEKLNGTRRTGLQTILDLDKVIEVANIQPTEDEQKKVSEGKMTEEQLLAAMRTRAKTHFETNIRDNTNWNDDSNHLLYFRTEPVTLDTRDIDYKQPLYNFYFVPLTNLEKDPKIKQTIGWTGGDGFDPLQ
ncbi:RagB/SusD family nutrient uptake outer membrane protein [Botryobacter ruber]|uniref:RagB/SusD family nutrient uptake outer membrane protein n=1 Tax=Botryobacter ruber TaxID=2171629 RepID=UPI000E0A06CA|nr:RagB/SusD family nutrient uptake outer membrane protein [Botryobacter ruber]